MKHGDVVQPLDGTTMRRVAGNAKSAAEVIVRSCVNHLFSLLDDSGRFVYAHKHLAPDQTGEGYNLLRHCGTVWFMCKAIHTLSIDLSGREKRALMAAVLYIRARTKAPPWHTGPSPALCVTARDAVKLGNVGLAALMIRGYAQLASETDTASLASLYPEGFDLHCTSLENYIISQLKEGSFVHKRVFSTGEIRQFESDYYTGEALFALMQSSRHIPRVRVAMEQMLHDGYGLAQQSHWMAYAACASLRVDYCDRALTTTYVGRLIDRIASDESYRYRQESTPIACRTEALVEILRTCRQNTYLNQRLPKAAIDKAATIAAENLALQLKYYGDGQFRRGRVSDQVRIDYIQHNGAAFLGWWQLLH
ncbi:hypothetical protein MMON_55010 [Mycolicibacterium monacense]|uniref:Uncharacterized protein n=2 Tax=Mycobacteriaceae TaxID=1762 RepID=A0AAD1J204_MYCMB|nr:hypothetical protein [Mycolicibacterium monacense DSM 44395]BBZ64200.1 hypothetical protein MMON_55010 [Mycolicibacterium monacense]